jgi:hypothetical protein
MPKFFPVDNIELTRKLWYEILSYENINEMWRRLGYLHLLCFSYNGMRRVERMR